MQVVHPFRAVHVRDPTRTPAGERRPVDRPIIGGQIDVLAIWSEHVIVVEIGDPLHIDPLKFCCALGGSSPQTAVSIDDQPTAVQSPIGRLDDHVGHT